MLHFYAIADSLPAQTDVAALRFLGFMSQREHQNLKGVWNALQDTPLQLSSTEHTRLLHGQVQDLHRTLLEVYQQKPQLWEHSSYKHFEDVLLVALGEAQGLLVVPS